MGTSKVVGEIFAESDVERGNNMLKCTNLDEAQIPGSLSATTNMNISLSPPHFKMILNCTRCQGCHKARFYVRYVSGSCWAVVMGFLGFLLRGLALWPVGPVGPWEL